jgi:methanogenic corrinoid protein MtbC1
MTEMENVVKAVEEAGIRENTKVMIGGAPVTQNYCESIGADLYAPDAASAADSAVEACG